MYNYRTMQESIPQWYSNPTTKDCSTTNYWQPNRATKIKHNISMMLPVHGACFFLLLSSPGAACSADRMELFDAFGIRCVLLQRASKAQHSKVF